jgi:AcrR family transcriptional regulator
MANSRSFRARANDALIRAVSIDLILSKGIDAISFRDVGRAAGLTHGALYARFEDVEELLVDVWNEALNTRLIEMYETTLRAVTNPNEETVRAVFDIVRNGAPADVVAVQVLLMSRRFVVLHEEVEAFIEGYLEADSDDVSHEVRSRTLILFSLIAVKIFTNFEFGIDSERLDFMQSVVLATSKIDASNIRPTALVESGNSFMPPPQPEDVRAQLAYATLNAVGRSGYTKTTISRISRRARSSPGAIYKIYPSKEDLVIAAIRATRRAPSIVPSTFSQVLDEGALAQVLYDAASEQNAIRKNFGLEMVMASAHNSRLHEVVRVQLRALESMALLVEGIPEAERKNLEYLIRDVVLLALGVSFLSTVTKHIEKVELSQFCEPFRLALLDRFPSWPDISRQMRSFSMEQLRTLDPGLTPNTVSN